MQQQQIKEPTTQRGMVVMHLNSHGEIDAFRAMRDYGIMRLADIIYKLKRDGGMRIKSCLLPFKNRFGNYSNYAKYYIQHIDEWQEGKTPNEWFGFKDGKMVATVETGEHSIDETKTWITVFISSGTEHQRFRKKVNTAMANIEVAKMYANIYYMQVNEMKHAN